MKKTIIALWYCICIISITHARPAAFESTEILPNDQVAFRIHAPQANKVSLHSDIRGQNVDFIKNEQGIWEGIYSDVAPGAYRYRFIVDGVTMFDPKNSSSTEAVSILMKTDGNDFFAMKEGVPHGAITERHYRSDTLNEVRRMHIWTPPGFEKSNQKLPVLYLIHGGGDTDNAWSTVGCAGNILDNLLTEGKIEPMLVVMPNARIPTPTMLGNLPIFKDDLMSDIIPFIEDTYNVYHDAKHRAIMGLSMGGLQTLEVAMHHYEEFDYICPLSSGWWISESWAKKRPETDNKELRSAQLKKIGADFNEKVKLLYFTQGGPEDLAYDNGMETLKLFEAAGIQYKFREIPGGHTWPVWRQDLRDLAPLLFK